MRKLCIFIFLLVTVQAFASSNIGIEVQSMATGKVLYQKNSERWFVPASTMKLFTAAAALLYLKPDFAYKTQFTTAKKITSYGDLNGDLTLKMSGDPSFKTEDLEQMVNQLRLKGLMQIDGDLVVDESVFNNGMEEYDGYASGWMWDELNIAYAAPIYSVILDENQFAVKLIPGKNVGDKTIIKPFNKYGKFTFENQISISERTKDCNLSLSGDEHNNYHLVGCLYKGDGPMALEVAISSPNEYLKDELEALLKKNNITLSGKIIFANKKYPDQEVLVQHRSEPLRELIIRMLKKSDNIYAGAIFKTIGARYYNTTGSWDNGSKAVRAILAKYAKIDLGEAVMLDGSGLSRYELVTPNLLSQLLYFAYHNSILEPEFKMAMPNTEEPGGLKYYFSKEKGLHVRAKTGSMTGISNLAGYVDSKNKKVYSFVIMINGFPDKIMRYRRLQAKLCRQFSAIG